MTAVVCIEVRCWICGWRYLLDVNEPEDERDRKCSCGAAREWSGWSRLNGDWVAAREAAQLVAAK